MRFTKTIYKPIRLLGIMMMAFVIAFIALNLLFPLESTIDFSTVVEDRDGKVLHAFLTEDDKWRMYTGLDEISPNLKRAIIRKEDRFFRYHPGVNPASIIRALYCNAVRQKITSGASTITMQVARMLQPKDRSYSNKAIEMFRALQLEWRYSKDEILQLYLNLVPYGGNIEGVKAAAVLYFQKEPYNLSIAEITTLSIIPNRPSSLRPGRNNRRLLEARNNWLARFREDGVFETQDIANAMLEPLEAVRTGAPNHAPHLAYRLKQQFPGRHLIRTHLELNQQLEFEQLTRNYINRLRAMNIKNAAVLVVDNETRNVIGYVGSGDFHSADDGGQVDGIRAIRQPGSTLKPLAYAIAMDHGLVTPKTILSDVPSNFSGYRPVNFDDRFNGYVSLEEALSKSLNVPAVRILKEIGIHSMIDKLKLAGFDQVAEDEHKLGLSLVLGGCGVSLESLTNLYACLANEGRHSPLSWTRSEAQHATVPLLSEASAFMITDVLSKLTRPDLPNNWRSSMHLPKIAWKTGTSYGRKDAWSVGYNHRFTVGVWVGNFSGEGVRELTGADMATPLLFQVFNELDYDGTNNWFKPPESLDFRLVCTESGKPAGDFCSQVVSDWFIPMVSSNQSCNHVREILVSANDSISYCRSCLPDAGFKVNSYRYHSPEMYAYFNANRIPYAAIPPHNYQCERIFANGKPQITSPTHQLEYIIDAEEPEQLLLACLAGPDITKVYWYIDDHLLQSAEPAEDLFFTPKEGRTKISCSDDKGRNTDIWVDVRYVRM